jgi:hypothetical protein
MTAIAASPLSIMHFSASPAHFSHFPLYIPLPVPYYVGAMSGS